MSLTKTELEQRIEELEEEKEELQDRLDQIDDAAHLWYRGWFS